MDSNLLSLFDLEEIFQRVGTKNLTGTLHLYTQRDSANLFFKSGVVVAALKGLIEGEDAIRQALELKDPQYVWLTDAREPIPPYKPIQINILDFLNRSRAKASEAGRPSKALPAKNPAAIPIAPAVPVALPVPFVVPGGLPIAAAPPPSNPVNPSIAPSPSNPLPIAVQVSRPLVSAPVSITATKSLVSSGSLRASQEDALLKKHQLTLTSFENAEQRIKLVRASSLVGRNPACDITLDHGSISRQHCLMVITDRGLHVKDLGSTNGTKVNNISLTEGYVSLGDKITIGSLVFILEKANA